LFDEATRAGKRQATPFAKGPPDDQPKKPGRKPGTDFGPKAHRDELFTFLPQPGSREAEGASQQGDRR
jgi:hypothetical protein